MPLQATYDCRTALHLAAIHGKLLAVSFLLSISADPTRKDRWGFTPLDYAIRGNHLLCAKLLRGQGGELGDNRSTQAATGLRTLDAQHTFAAVREAISEMQRKVETAAKLQPPFYETDCQVVEERRCSAVLCLPGVPGRQSRLQGLGVRWRPHFGQFGPLTHATFDIFDVPCSSGPWGEGQQGFQQH